MSSHRDIAPSPNHHFHAAVAVAVFVLVVGADGRQSPQAPPVFRAGVDIVQVDVSVLDKSRRPVRGLAAADFTILEDGKPQPIEAFLAVDVPDAPQVPVVAGKPVTWLRDVAPDVQTNDVAAGRLIVMLVDDLLMPNNAKVVASARQVMRAVIDKVGPADRMAVVFSQDGRQAQNFTNDRAKLVSAIEKIHPGPAVYTFGWESVMPHDEHRLVDPTHNPHPGPDPDSAFRDASLRSLRLVTDGLLAAPQRRKALIYLSPGIAINPLLAANLGLQSGRSQMAREANVRLLQQMPDMFREMQRANVAVYPIDPTGPNGIGPYILDRMGQLVDMRVYNLGALDPSTGEAMVQPCNDADINRPPWCHVPRMDEVASLAGRLSLDFLQTAATNTGGRAIVNTEDFDTGIAQIFAESGSYYLLGYRAPPGNKPGTLHRLTVTVSRPGVEVRTRSGYSTPAPEKIDPKHPDVSPTTKAIAGLLPNSDLALQVGLAPVAIPGKDEAAVTIVLGLQRAASSKPISDTVHVETRAFTPDGERRGIQLQDAFIAIRPSTTDANVSYEALSSITLKPGRYQLRIAAYSATNDAAGSVYADVEVPDFTKAPVSLSGVLIAATPAVPVQPVEVLAKIVPVVPTAARVFQKLNQVTAFVRAYQGGKLPPAAATMAVRLTNEHGEIVVNQAETFAADRFSGPARSVDYRFAIPMMTLARGAYLLSFEVSLGAASARRDVRFSVR